MLLSLQAVAVEERLQPVSLQVHPGQLIHVVGPNGAGKSTLLRVLSGLQTCSGKALLLDKPLDEWPGPALAQVRAWLPQQSPSLGQMPVFHYLRLHLPTVSATVDDPLSDLLDKLQLTDKLTRPLTQLSGGEWQRVRLAAVCAQIDPRINAKGRLLILDEPMTALDIAQQKAVDEIICALCLAGVSVIASSHDLNHSLLYADIVWLMHQGRLVAQGVAESILTPQQLSPLYQVTFRQLELEGRRWLTVLP